MNIIARLRNRTGQGTFLRLFSSSVLNQAILSASNLLVGLILIRHSSDDQYGYYLLAINTIMLLTGLQSAFLHSPMALRISRDGNVAWAGLVASLFRTQNRFSWGIGMAVGLIVLGLFALGRIDAHLASLLCAITLATVSALYREFFRTILFVSRRPHPVLMADMLYVVVQFGGALAASRTEHPAVLALVAMALAASLCGWSLDRALRQVGGIDRKPDPALSWRDILDQGQWSVGGAAAHWTFTQGYNYLVAALLDVASLSALGATRLLLMPINLLSAGIGPLIMPFAAEWLHKSGPNALLRKITLLACGVTGLSILYLIVLWLTRNWIFDNVMHKHFANADLLIGLWSLNFLVTAFRDRLIAIPSAYGQFKVLCYSAAVAAVLALIFCWFGVRAIGITGAPLAVLFGECINFVFIIALSIRLTRQAIAALAAHPKLRAADVFGDGLETGH